MSMDEPLSRHIEEMRNMANILVPYSFPSVSIVDELIINPLKHRVFTVDGYEIAVMYGKSTFQKHQIETLQIESIYSPFLPFNLVCKLAKSFLGEDNLFYMDMFKNGKKSYCWIVRWADGAMLPPNAESESMIYEGFKYNILDIK